METSNNDTELPQDSAEAEQQQAEQMDFPQFISDVIVARRDPTGYFYIVVPHEQKVGVPLAWFLAAITNNRGHYVPLGMAYDHSPGTQCLQIAIHYTVPADSDFKKQINDLVEHILKQGQTQK